jgi:hypothetical protein
LSLDEVLARDPACALQNNTRTVRESNALNLSVFTNVLRTGSQVMYEKTIDEVLCQRIYGALSRLSYGAVICVKVAPLGFEPTTSSKIEV